MCPMGLRTGGSEALFQLCHEINLFPSTRAWLVPSPGSERRTKVVFGRDYNTPVKGIESAYSADVCIFPESYYPSLKNHIRKLKDAGVLTVTWWLSVDYAMDLKARKTGNRNQKLSSAWSISYDPRVKVVSLLQNLRVTIGLQLRKILGIEGVIKADVHLYQSEYARAFLEEINKSNASHLGDYIGEDYINVYKNQKTNSLKNINRKNEHHECKVLVNVKKGRDQAKLVMDLLPKYDFILIENMSLDEIKTSYLSSCLYLDFGHFPGKDRQPREARASGVPVILASRGATKHGDFQISRQLRFDMDKETPTMAATQIEQTLIGCSSIKKQKLLSMFNYDPIEEKIEFHRDVDRILRNMRLTIFS